MADSPIEALERWEDHGAVWRIRHLSDALAVVDLCTCDGDPVERLESDDRELISYLRRSGRLSA
jgi:hypothetical protein